MLNQPLIPSRNLGTQRKPLKGRFQRLHRRWLAAVAIVGLIATGTIVAALPMLSPEPLAARPLFSAEQVEKIADVYQWYNPPAAPLAGVSTTEHLIPKIDTTHAIPETSHVSTRLSTS